MKTYDYQNLNEEELRELSKRPAIDFAGVNEVVRDILDEIKENGDKAVRAYTEKFDGVSLENFLVSEEEMRVAADRLSEDIKESFTAAATNIEKFHRAQIPEKQIVETSPGVKCFSESRAIEKVGLYVPGGLAPLPSTVLMLGIPARIAGCPEIIMCTPPDKNGQVPDIILYAASLAGITKIFKIGGAQAIAAMAYGTETVPKVYKLFGPGNQYVTAAKMLTSIEAEGPAIDMPAGPSEVLVIADQNAKADFVAADLLSQAEHGPDSQVVLVSDNQEKITEILGEIDTQLATLPRQEIAKKALENSIAIKTENIEQSIEFSNRYAPEHLILNIENAENYLEKIINAGSVFIGEYSCESAGDYASGTNHTLPTYGYVRSYSGVNLASFTKRITFQKLSPEGVKNLGPVVEKMAEIEELDGHKRAMSLRIRSIK